MDRAAPSANQTQRGSSVCMLGTSTTFEMTAPTNPIKATDVRQMDGERREETNDTRETREPVEIGVSAPAVSPHAHCLV
jgi:hypothetical protein